MITSNIMKKEIKKPKWITQEQWNNVPSVQWWKDQKQGEIYIKQSKPVTPQEALAQTERLRTSKNWNQGV